MGEARLTVIELVVYVRPVDTKGFVTYEDRYGKERATDSALDEALNLLEEAQRKCEQGRELEEIHGYGMHMAPYHQCEGWVLMVVAWSW